MCKVSWSFDQKQKSSWTLYEKHELSSRNRKCRKRKLTKGDSIRTTDCYWMILKFCFWCLWFFSKSTWDYVQKKKNHNNKKKENNNRSFRRSRKALIIPKFFIHNFFIVHILWRHVEQEMFGYPRSIDWYKEIGP